MNESVSKSYKPEATDGQSVDASKLESSVVSKQEEEAISKQESPVSKVTTKSTTKSTKAPPPKVDLYNDEYIKSVIKEAIESIIGDVVFTPLKTQQWSNQIIDTITKRLIANGEHRKFVIHTTLSPSGAGNALCSATQCYWNDFQDAAHGYQWESATTYAIVFIFFFAHTSARRATCSIQ